MILWRPCLPLSQHDPATEAEAEPVAKESSQDSQTEKLAGNSAVSFHLQAQTETTTDTGRRVETAAKVVTQEAERETEEAAKEEATVEEQKPKEVLLQQ